MTPSTLRECSFQISYGPADDRLNQFYIPALSASVRYDRSAGFFSSSSLAIAAQGVASLIKNGGRMRLLVGAELSEQDADAIRKGADMSDVIANRLLATFEDPVEELQQRRLEALAWMIADGSLEIRVVLPRGADGHALAAADSWDYYHPKEGIFTDAAGDLVAFSGSVNESAQAWQHNYEQFSVYFSWDGSAPYLAQVRRRFDMLWEDREPSWIGIPAPDAVRERLVRLRPNSAPEYDPLQRRQPAGTGTVNERPTEEYQAGGVEAPQRDRIIFQFLRDAPYLRNASALGLETSTVRPWPHQARLVEDVLARFPESFLLCDEVGLGKTVECGLILRQLLLDGRAGRVLLLVPKSLTKQWQDELYEKFSLNVPVYDGFRLIDHFGRDLTVSGMNSWNSAPVIIASAQLAKRQVRKAELLAARPWDLLVVDEAHHARRREFNVPNPRKNRMLELLTELRERTKCVYLLTATPMQLYPVEVWDLLKLLGLGGRWGAGDANFVRFFHELSLDPELRDWRFLFGMLRDYVDNSGTLDDRLVQTIRERVGPVEWAAIEDAQSASDPWSRLKHLSPLALSATTQLLREHTPLRRYMQRNTRRLLREYVSRGILTENVPTRKPDPEWIAMPPDERTLYDRIDEYISDFYQKYEAERKGLGFVMTVYRRRLTSSFYAIERSLERRLGFLRGETGNQGFDDDDTEQDDLDNDAVDETEDGDRARFLGELKYVEDFLFEIRNLQGDSKFERLTTVLRELFKSRDTAIVFSQYADTMDYLRGRLSQVYGGAVGCYSGRGGEWWDGSDWKLTTKEDIKTRFKDGQIKILVCTEAASEGLNLQSCGVLVNYDMPWNPMRVEQRIGRIDRIGQRFPDVWIRHLFFEDTVEAQVYNRLSSRIGWFVNVVGELQPILARVSRVIERVALTAKAKRAAELETELERLKQDIESARLEELDLDSYLHLEVSTPELERPPVTLKDIEEAIVGSVATGSMFRPHPHVPSSYILSLGGKDHAVTFTPDAFDAHPDTLRLLTFGEDLLRVVLSLVANPETTDAGPILRASTVEDPKAVDYYRPGPEPLTSLGEVAQAIEAGEGVWPSDAKSLAEQGIRDLVEGRAKKESEMHRQEELGERLSLEERARQVLLLAAHIELVEGLKPDMFRDIPAPEFSQSAMTRLARHGFPFAGLLRITPLQDLAPNPADQIRAELLTRGPEALRARFELVKTQAGELLFALARPAEPDSLQTDISVISLIFGEGSK